MFVPYFIPYSRLNQFLYAEKEHFKNHELEVNMGLLIVEELRVWKPLCPGQHHLSIEEVWPYLHYAALVT